MSGNGAAEKGGVKLLRLLSYNLFVRPPIINSHGTDYKDERLAMFINEVRDYDVLCLQELFNFMSTRRSDFVAKCKKQGYVDDVFIDRHIAVYFPRIVDGGVNIISRLPFAQTDAYVYTMAEWRSSDAIAHKGVVYARLQISTDRHVHVFTTHLQAGDHTDGRYEAVRRDQVEEMVHFIHRSTGDDGHPAIVTGDFNIDGKRFQKDGSDGAEYLAAMRTLSQNGKYVWRDLLKEACGGIHPNTGGDSWVVNRDVKIDEQCESNNKRLDYVLYREGTKWNMSL
eukprot:comp21729_c0_seq2/m.30731 comp21729_c0_seq2/g.30731  ORF comp21729_c0_seq2/g.30731 comp21729_c0_seq2/m.30731 type:complete len:282 (-) comp21729_c0_seq2:64-909(-)